MTNPEITSYLSEAIAGLFASWPLKAHVEISEDEGVVLVEVTTDKDEIFIQPSADPLLALQHLLRLMVRRRFPQEFVHVSLNIGGFRDKQKDALRRLVKDALQRLRDSGEPVTLSPMSSFERRLVHTLVADEADVVSESTGAGPSRRVVIKPAT